MAIPTSGVVSSGVASVQAQLDLEERACQELATQIAFGDRNAEVALLVAWQGTLGAARLAIVHKAAISRGVASRDQMATLDDRIAALKARQTAAWLGA